MSNSSVWASAYRTSITIKKCTQYCEDFAVRMTGPLDDRKRLNPGEIFWFAVIFVAQFAFAPLYTENQNTKFLHGLADAGKGYLAADWMAGTRDPLPVFSGIIQGFYGLDLQWLIDPALVLLWLVYAYSLVAIARRHFPVLEGRASRFLFAALFILFNSNLLSMDEALAKQYIVAENYFEPCVFGAFLLLGIERYLAGRLLIAAACFSLAAAVHPTYIPAGAVLVGVTGLLHLVHKRDPVRPLLAGGLFVLAVGPLVYRHVQLFAASSPEIWEQANHILSNIRIPHHTKVDRFLGVGAVLQLLLMGLSLYFVRATRLFWVMLALYVPILGSLLWVAAAPNDWLSFTTPWRLSVVLQPIAATILLAVLSLWLAQRFRQQETAILRTAYGLLAVAVVAGAMQQVKFLNDYHQSPAMAAMRLAARDAGPGQVYLVPPRSRDFHAFRLETGLPIYINWKTHPYYDREILEWYRRYRLAEGFYDIDDDGERCRVADWLHRGEGVSHVVAPVGRSLAGCLAWSRLGVTRRFEIWAKRSAGARPPPATPGAGLAHRPPAAPREPRRIRPRKQARRRGLWRWRRRTRR